MAERTIKTRISLLYKSYAEWQLIKDSFVPMAGEVCIVNVPAETGSVVNEPAILFKVGDGTSKFSALPYSSALAADVYGWAKKEHLDFDDLGDEFEAKLKAFIKNPEVSYDTKYQLVSAGKDKWQLQKSTNDGETWVDATGLIDISTKVDKTITGTAGKSLIFNEADGGGSKFEGNNGINAYAGTHDSIGGQIGAQIYATKDAQNTGVIIDVVHGGAYYTKGNILPGVQRDVAANEIAVKGDIHEYNLIKDAAPGEYAAVFHLTKDGINIGEPINIAKDQFFQGAEVRTCTEPDVPVRGLVPGDKYLDLMFGSDPEHIQHAYIPVKDMVKAYTAGEGIEITSENEIKLTDEAIGEIDKIAEIQKIVAYAGVAIPEEGETPQEALERTFPTAIPGEIGVVNNTQYVLTKTDDPAVNEWVVKDAEKQLYELKADADAEHEAIHTDLSGKVDKRLVGTNGTAEIFNESDGGGAHFIHNDGSESFVGVNDGGESGMMAQIYADKKINGAWVGSRINVYHDGIYYVSKADQQAGATKNDPDQEIVVKKQLNFNQIEQTEGDVLILNCNI